LPLIRFLGLFIPALIVLVLAYFMIKEMYPDMKVALISAAILSVLWEHIFYSNRFHTENFALIFEFLAIFILFKGYMKKEKIWFLQPKYSLVVALLFSLISVIFRPGNIRERVVYRRAYGRRERSIGHYYVCCRSDPGIRKIKMICNALAAAGMNQAGTGFAGYFIYCPNRRLDLA
jgi:hypothetical protein